MIKKLFFAALLIISSISATKAQLLNYQGIARNANGVAISFQDVSLRLTIHDLISAGPTLYSETRLVRTNQFGLINLVIGSPGAVNTIGSISAINWAVGSKFLQVEIDPLGGSNFQNAGTSQLQSVPYAFFANAAYPVGPAGGDLLGSTYPNPIIAAFAVTTNKLADTAVTTRKIADSAVTTAKILNSAVTTEKIMDSAVTTTKLRNSGVTTEKIADSAVNTAKILNSAVTTEKIMDSAVTTAKLRNKGVTTEKIADSAITNEKIKNGSITNEKITNGTIQNIKLVNSTITLNGLVLNLGGSQSFVVDSAGSDVNIASANNIHRFNFPNASIANRGLITPNTQTIGGNKIFNNSVTAASFIKNGGIAAQFLKADGSVDNNIYLTANQPIIITATGDATGISTSSGTAPVLPLTLATVNSTVGTYGTNIVIPAVTVNEKGLVTNVITNPIPTATSTTLGLLTAANWNTFNNKQNFIPLGTTAQYFRGDLSLSNFQTDVRAQLSAGTNITYTNGQFGITNNSVTINTLPLTLGGSQTFATGTGGIDFNISSLGTVHSFNIPSASTFARGLLTSTDYTNFSAAYSNRINSLTTTGPYGPATLGSNILNIPTYVLPAATATTLGGTIIGANISNSGGTISLNNNNITSALGSQSANLVFASPPNGAAGTPSFRSIVVGDIPTLNQNTTGNAATVTTNANLTGPITSTGNNTAIASQTGTGSTFVMNNSPTLVTPILGAATATTINGNTFTTGTYTLTGGGAFTSTLPSATGTLALNNGGNWTFASQAIGDIAQASSTTAYSRLAAVATGNVLISGGVNTLSSWGKVGLSTHVSGILPIANGGTGATTKATAFDALSPMTASGDIIYGAAAGTGTRLPVGSNGQILTLTAGLIPSWSTPASNNQWSILGNTGLVNGTHFLGTSDNAALRFRVNSIWAGEINPITTNTSYGYESGLNNVATVNINNNTSFGHSALKETQSGGVDNTAMGQGALQNNISGDNNTAIGQGALNGGFGSSNTAVGQASLRLNVTDRNTAIGRSALETSTLADNTALGYLAGRNFGATFIDPNLATSIVRSVMLGSNTRTQTVNSDNEIVIGFNAVGNGNNTAQIGNTNTILLNTSGAITSGGRITGTGARFAYFSPAINYQITINDYYIKVTDPSISLTLPSAIGINGQRFVIFNATGGNYTIATSLGQTFTGATGTLPSNTSLKIFSDGANWLVE